VDAVMEPGSPELEPVPEYVPASGADKHVYSHLFGLVKIIQGVLISRICYVNETFYLPSLPLNRWTAWQD